MRLALVAVFSTCAALQVSGQGSPRLEIRIDRVQAVGWAPQSTPLTDIILNVENRESVTVFAAIIQCSIWDEQGRALMNTYATVSNLEAGAAAVATASIPLVWKQNYKVRCSAS